MQGCDLVFALGHLRWGNDEKLAAGAPEIDLVFGGHDHDSGDRIVRINTHSVSNDEKFLRKICAITRGAIHFCAMILEPMSDSHLQVSSIPSCAFLVPNAPFKCL